MNSSGDRVVQSYDALRGDVEVFVIDGDHEPGACGQWIAAENPVEVRQ